MAENSNIEWCDHTFNAWLGCTKVSPACDHCYAEVQCSRFKQVEWGAHADRKRTSVANWKKPLKWNRDAESKGIRYRVFCASLADVFDNHKSILPEWRADLWALIKKTPHLDWLILTKRPQNIARYLPDDWGIGYDNVWLGTTVENQKEADRRILYLAGIPSKIKFLSCEPLLESVDITRWLWPFKSCYDCPAPIPHLLTDKEKTNFSKSQLNECCKEPELMPSIINWVICGGESGKGSRPMNPAWSLSLKNQCESAGVSFFFKQWGDWLPWISFLDAQINDDEETRFDTAFWDVDKGEWDYCGKPMWMQIKDNYGGGANSLDDCNHFMGRVGKKSAGRSLGGVIYDQYPGDKNG